MGFIVIKKEECNYVTDNLELLKYAILEENGRFYLQVKIKNISDSTINSFTMVYKINGEKCKYHVDYISNPGEEFLDKTLIEIDDDDFEFIDFKKVDKDIEEAPDDNDTDEMIDNKENNNDDFDDFGFSEKPKKKSEIDTVPWILWILSLAIDILSIIIWIILTIMRK